MRAMHGIGSGSGSGSAWPLRHTKSPEPTDTDAAFAGRPFNVGILGASQQRQSAQFCATSTDITTVTFRKQAYDLHSKR